ncbi:hypothetical protein [Pseudoclavibacter sp. CFCC 13611]|uniref:hypothetical protein n=1 Tax=Pseudoclavibacter sp. CFCC 13611 TaxID=2615178 RepID=UPI0013012D78|nr:hypothetical protein [Pseudoclavibacter sp. CFCC 13611]KAB1663424.1 hypothetical protein F8O08_06665 [Pseudoclavibacter sp. CFCC 13611]
MRKAFATIALIGALALAGCSAQDGSTETNDPASASAQQSSNSPAVDSPTDVVKRLIKAMSVGDCNEVKATMESDGIDLGQCEDGKGADIDLGSVVYTGEQIDGDTATVNVTYQNRPAAVVLKKQDDGRWIVDWKATTQAGQSTPSAGN